MKTLILTVLAGLLLTGGAVLADHGEEAEVDAIGLAESVTLADLEVADPGLLPTSPFYFFKEWGRGVQSFFAFNAVSKAEFQAKVSNEKAAELQAVAKLDPQNEAAIERALSNFASSQERLTTRLELVRETSENPNVDRLLDRIAQRTILHEKLLEEVKGKHEDKELIRLKAEEVRGALARVVQGVAGLDTPEHFTERLKNALENSPGSAFKHIRSVEFIDHVQENLSDEVKTRLDSVRDEFTEKVKERIEIEGQDGEKLKAIFEHIPGDTARRAVVLEEIRVRVSDRVAEALGKVQEDVEERIADSADRKEKAAEQIRKAGEVLSKAQLKAREANAVRQAVKELIAQAERHLASAKLAFEQEQYGEAFGQARAAEVAARNALRVLEGGEDSSGILERVKTKVQDRVNIKEQIRVSPESLRPVPDVVVCTSEYEPVCGVDGVTYTNTCVAERQKGVKVAHKGECVVDLEAPSSDSGTNIIDVEASRLSSQEPSSITQVARVKRSLEADDNGFYPGEIRVPKGSLVSLEIKARPLGVYFGGLDFRSDKFKTNVVKPGETTTVEFVADESFELTSWWPASSVLKARAKVVVE